MKRRILVDFTDTQGGNDYGLLPPGVTLSRSVQTREKTFLEYYNPLPNPTQQYLWDEVYTWGREEIFKLAGKDDIFVIHGGDLNDGTKYNFITGLDNQIAIGTAILEPWIAHRQVKGLRLLDPTEAHRAGDITIVRLLREKYNKSISIVPHGLLNLGDAIIDYAHHGPSSGIREWTTGNQLRYYMRSIIFDALKSNSPIPDLILRHHFHDLVWESLHEWIDGEMYTTNGFIVPSLQMMTDYARRATSSQSKVRNGMVAIEIIGGKVVDVHWFVKESDVRTAEVLP